MHCTTAPKLLYKHSAVTVKEFHESLLRMTWWGKDQRGQTMQAITIIDDLVCHFAPLALEEAGAGSAARKLRDLPYLNENLPDVIERAALAERVCDEMRIYLLDLNSDGKIDGTAYEIGTHLLEHTSMAVGLVPNLLGMKDLNSFSVLLDQVLECVAEAHGQAERLNPTFPPTHKRFMEARTELADTLFGNCF